MNQNPALPSGYQVEIRSGRHHAVITELGGGLRTYNVGPRAVLDGYDSTEMCSGGRGQLLLPWPNRIGDGAYRFRDANYQLALTDPSKHNAIHGLVRWVPWSLDQQGPDHAVAHHRLHPQPGYPFSLDLEVDYQVSEQGLRVEVAATNVGDKAAPYGAGQHPFLSVGTEFVDDAVLQVPASAMVPADERGLPTGDPVSVADTAYDFRQPRRIGPAVMDVCYAELARDADGMARVVLSHPSGDPAATLWADESVDYVMVFSGDTLAANRRRRSLAIEPMTCPPDAFRSGTALLVIEPGQRTTTTWGISPTAA